jgi:hypothetical protein
VVLRLLVHSLLLNLASPLSGGLVEVDHSEPFRVFTAILTYVPTVTPLALGMANPVAGIAGSAAKSVRPFRSSEAYVEAMKEDLADWLNALYSLGLPGSGDGFLTGLATGTTLCQHANAVTEAARALAAARPTRGVAFQAHSVAPGSFMARDNVASFIGWCRAELGVPEVLMFETEDLVLRKNEKSVVLCLLEVARRGARLGLLAPRLVQFEQEIERELRATPQVSSVPAAEEDVTEIATVPGVPTRTPRMTPNDLRNLDELVSLLISTLGVPSRPVPSPPPHQGTRWQS